AVDLDGDGILDLAVAVGDPGDGTPGHVAVLMGDGAHGVGDGTFAPPIPYDVGSGPHTLVAAYLDNDTVLDLAVSHVYSGDGAVLLGSGGGAFAPPSSLPVGGYVRTVRAADVDGDGRTDLVASSFDAGRVKVFLGQGNGTFVLNGDYANGTPHDI